MTSSISLIGTTSGGKSTIGNLLSGRYILPAGVQETTTSIIEVYHDKSAYTSILSLIGDNKKSRQRWIRLVSDAEIRRHVEKAMSEQPHSIFKIGIRLSMGVKDPIYPEMNSNLRTGLSSYPVKDKLRIEDGFVIRDFPGFQHHQDTNRLRVVEEHFDQRGVFLFVFNAEETDHTKEEQLLKMFVSLLRRRGCCWRSIVFVLNRKDAFRRDRDPEHSLRSALALRRARIKQIISATWKHITESETPHIVPLAAGPIFASEMLCWHNRRLDAADRAFLEYQVDKIALPLLPPSLQKRLARSPRLWTHTQWVSVYKSLRAVSGLNALLKALATQDRHLQGKRPSDTTAELA